MYCTELKMSSLRYNQPSGTYFLFSILFFFQIFEELQSIFGDDKERCPTYEELQNMPVLDRCIKEVLRMYPPGYIIARKVRQEIKIDEHVIPKGTDSVTNFP